MLRCVYLSQASSFLRHRFYSMKCLTLFDKTNEENLYQYEVPIKIENSDTIFVNAVFQDTLPCGSAYGTVLTMHGAPGSHKDFKYMVPYFVEKNIRVIGINFPGFGYSSMHDQLHYNNDEREQFIRRILEALNLQIDHRLIIVGHSRGCVDAIRLAAKLKDTVLGVVPINFVGNRPHRGVRPFFVTQTAAWLWSLSYLRPVLLLIYEYYYNRILNFRVTGEVAAISVQTMNNIDFEGQQRFVEELNTSSVFMLASHAGKDPLMEPEVCREFTDALNNNQEFLCSKEDNENEIIQFVSREFATGRRRISLNFPDDGHFLQKHRAEVIARCTNEIFRLKKTSHSKI